MDKEQFYPTPRELLEQVFDETDWRYIGTVLEPSAGNGDICDYIKEVSGKYPYYSKLDMDCIEINHNRQTVLKGKEYRVIYDNFLDFQTHKHYDLIAMNPPFAEGEKHLLKALDLQKDGGSILCILNAETLRNPYTNERKLLVRKLKELGAEIEYLQSAFAQAEVRTDVEVAVIKVSIPLAEDVSYIFEQLRKSPKYAENVQEWENTDVAVNDIVEAIVSQCEMELDAGIKLIHEYWAMKPKIMNTFDPEGYKEPIISMNIRGSDVSINEYVKSVRHKYWSALFKNPKFVKGMTSEMQSNYLAKVNELENYDFNKYNIRTIQIEMSRHMTRGIEKCIVDLFDELSYRHSMDCEKNIHYFNGWRTNQAWIINRKVIIPIYDLFSDIWHEFRYSYRASQKLSDIEKVFNYLAGVSSDYSSLPYILQNAERKQESKNIEFRYFTCNFYKKGTCHIIFKDEELLKKFNIFGARQKGWLPPAYGKKSYQKMSDEEKAVVDSFEGEASYAETCARPDYYLYEPKDKQYMIEMFAA